jgi:hypothetical protein
MFFSLLLITLGVYLGQEYPNLPVVKNGFMTLISYMHKLHQEHEQTNKTNHLSSSSEKSYLSVFYKLYSVVSNLNVFKRDSVSDSQEQLDDFSIKSDTNINTNNSEVGLRKRFLDVLSEDEMDNKRSKETFY